MLRTAVIGVGHLGRQHARVHAALAAEGVSSFAGVCDIDEETALRAHVRRPLYFEVHRVGQFTARSLDIDVVLDLMIHDLDIVQWLVGAEVEATEVRAVGIPILTNRVDAANARIEFSTGAVANITASRVGTEKIRKMRFFQPHDYIAVDYATRHATVSNLAPPSGAHTWPGVNTRHLEVNDVEPLR